MLRVAQKRGKEVLFKAMNDMKQNNQKQLSSHATLCKDIKIAVVGSGKHKYYQLSRKIKMGISLLWDRRETTNLRCSFLGPAGFYASQHLINHGGDKLTVDIFERLPVPFGLVS